MITLDYTNTQLLSLTTGQNGASVIVSYADKSASGYDPEVVPTPITSATTTTICGTPAIATKRDIDHIIIKNTYAGSHTVTLNFSSSATLYPLFTIALAQGDMLEYTHSDGLKVLDSNGNVKVAVPSVAVTSITGLGTGIATALAVNVGSAGAPVINGGALGSPSSAGTLPAFTLSGAVTGNGQNISGLGTIGSGTITSTGVITSTGTSIVSKDLSAFSAGSNGAFFQIQGLDSTSANANLGVIRALAQTSQNSTMDLRVLSAGTATTILGLASTGAAVTGTLSASSTAAIGTTTNASYGLVIGSSALTGTDQMGLRIDPTASIASTSSFNAAYIRGNTAVASFTAPVGRGLYIADFIKGSGSTITQQVGLEIAAQTQGGTNYAIKTGGGKLSFIGLPTSSAGLASGDVWLNSNVLTIVP